MKYAGEHLWIHNTSNLEADGATATEEHTGCHSCQLRTGNWGYNSYRLTKIGQCLPWSDELRFLLRYSDGRVRIDLLQRPPSPLVIVAMSDKPWCSHATHHFLTEWKIHCRAKVLFGTDNVPTDTTEQVTSGMKQSLSFQIFFIFKKLKQ